MENKNLLFIFNQYPGTGGLESASNNIIQYLGKYYTIYTLSITQQQGIVVPDCIQKMYQFESISNKTACTTLLNKILEENQIDYIINQGIYPHISNILFTPERKHGVKIFSFLHGMPGYEEKQYWQHFAMSSKTKWLKRKFLSKIGLNKNYIRYVGQFAQSYITACKEGDKVILLCKQYIPSFVQIYGLEAYQSKILSIPNPLSSSTFIHEIGNGQAKKNQVLFVGRLSLEKRVHIILEAWKNIQTEANWELIIVGDGETRAKLEQMVQKQKIQRVSFTGWINSVEAHYKEAKIILLTSEYEGLPMCLLEAQQYGVVPLVFNISQGVRSIVADPAQMLVPQNDCRALTAKLVSFIKNDTQLSHLSHLSLLKAKEYTLSKIGKQWEALLSDQSNEL